MEKYFVTYEQALALKELGFNKKCFNLFDKNGSLMYKPNGNIVMIKIDNHNKTNFCSAPLKIQVFEWFREKHFLTAFVETDFGDEFYSKIEEIRHPRTLSLNEKRIIAFSKTYEEAESVCIDKLIELITK